VKEDREKAKRNINRALAGEGFVQEAYSREEARSRLHFTVSHRPITAKDGAIVGVAVIAKDITERRRMEAELEKHAKHLEELVEARTRELTQTLERERILGNIVRPVSIAIDIAYPDGRIDHWNPAFLELTGYTEEEAKSINWMKTLTPPEWQEFEATQLEEAKRSGKTVRYEKEYTRKDGTVIPVELVVQPMFDEKGNLKSYFGFISDITERKRMEEKLRSARERLEYIIGSNPGVVYLAKPLEDMSDYSVVYKSKNVVSMVGYEYEQFLGPEGAAFWASRIHPDDLLKYREGTSKFWEDGHRICEYRFLHRDGTYRWIMEEANVVRDPAGKVLDVVGCWTDITDRKRMEEELRSIKERLEYVIQSNPAVIYSGKPLADFSDWEQTYASPRIVSMFGYEPEKFVGHPGFWATHIHPDDLKVNPEVVQALWRKGHHTFEYRFRHNDGSYRWIREEATVTRNDNGIPIEVNGYWIDVTALKQAEQAVVVGERKHRELFNSAREGIFTCDHNAVITLVNPRLAEMSGYAQEEIVGKELLAFIHESDRSMAEAALERQRLGVAEEYSTRIVRKDGAPIHVNVTSSPIMDEKGAFAGWLAFVSDMTERKRLEAQLAEAQRLAAIGQTTAMVGHDLRNPLQATTGSLYLAKMLLNSGKAEDRKEVVKLLNALDDQILYMDKIVSDLQHYAGPIGVEPVGINLSELIEDALSTANIPENVETKVVGTQEGLSEIMLDPVLVKRILLNLILNAVQAMPNGGKLVVESSKKDDLLTVSVQDTGIGIPSEHVGKLFDPFFTTKAKGQGLGLPVCKRLLEAQNGSITVNSEVGKGSTFTFTIPISRPRTVS
jgi:PAS domain S-box-containing protein